MGQAKNVKKTSGNSALARVSWSLPWINDSKCKQNNFALKNLQFRLNTCTNEKKCLKVYNKISFFLRMLRLLLLGALFGLLTAAAVDKRGCANDSPFVIPTDRVCVNLMSFNIQVFGQTKMSKPEVVTSLVKVYLYISGTSGFWDFKKMEIQFFSLKKTQKTPKTTACRQVLHFCLHLKGIDLFAKTRWHPFIFTEQTEFSFFKSRFLFSIKAYISWRQWRIIKKNWGGEGLFGLGNLSSSNFRGQIGILFVSVGVRAWVSSENQGKNLIDVYWVKISPQGWVWASSFKELHTGTSLIEACPLGHSLA